MEEYETRIIKMCMEIKNKRGFKTHKIMFFTYTLIKNKEIYNMDMIKNYLMVFYNPSNDTLQKVLKILQRNNLIKISKNLMDCRKYIVFPI